MIKIKEPLERILENHITQISKMKPSIEKGIYCKYSMKFVQLAFERGYKEYAGKMMNKIYSEMKK